MASEWTDFDINLDDDCVQSMVCNILTLSACPLASVVPGKKGN